MTTPAVATARVVCLAGDLAGGYCTRLLADGGAQVLRVEDPTGDPLRRWSHSGPTPDEGALFQFLAAGSTSSWSPTPRAHRDAACGRRHRVVAPLGRRPASPPDRLRALNPRAVVTAITNFGLSGPWVDRPATDLTLQAMSGGPGLRGRRSVPPLIAGGRLREWVAGMFAAVHSAAAFFGGGAELLDVSVLEALILTTTAHPVSCYTVAGAPMRPFGPGTCRTSTPPRTASSASWW